MRESLVAINVVDKNSSLLNPTPVPILFYWDGKDSLEDIIKESNDFKEFISYKTFNSGNYTTSSINYFFFEYDEEGNEKYTEGHIDVQSLYLLENMSEQESLFYYEYLMKHVNKLYVNAFKKEFINDSGLKTDDIIKEIYNQIQGAYSSKFSYDTFINYMRLNLQKHENMNSQNIEFVLDNLKNMLKFKL